MDETNNVVNTTFQSSQQEPPAGISIAALILGICSIVFCCFWYVSLITGIIAIILGVKAKKDNAGKQGMAKAGMICGIIGLVLAVVVFIAAASILATAGLAGIDAL